MTAPLGSSEQPPESPSPPAAPSESEASRRAGRKASAEFWVSPKAALLCLPLLALILGGHAFYYAPFLSDDALISLRYADRFVDGLGLTWTDGERVEGYTDFLWVLLTAGLHFLGVDLIAAARGLAFLGCAGGAVIVSLNPQNARPTMARVLSAGLGVALAAPVAIWAVGALEHGFMVGVIAGALYLMARSAERPEMSKEAWGAALLLCSLVLLRADGAVLVFGIALPVLFLRRKGALEKFALWAGLPMGALLAQHLFRYSYYSEWVPNTALAKVAMNEERVKLGITHVTTGLLALWPSLLAIALTGATGARNLRLAAVGPALGGALVWCVYLALVGGDIFPGWRQLLLGLIPLYFLFAQTTAAALEKLPEERVALHLSVLSVAILSFTTQRRDSENGRAKTERWEWAGVSVGPALKQAFGKERPLLAVDAAGALPYWSKLPCLDMLGLNDSYLAHNPPKDFGYGGIGHELGDGAYVLSRKPDLVAFNNAQGSAEPLFLSGREMKRSRQFRKDYSLMRLQGVGPEPAAGEIYVRKSGRVGLREAGNVTEIPGYFFSQGSALAMLGPDGLLATRLEAGQVARLDGLELSAGRYRVTWDPSPSDLDLVVRCQGLTMQGESSPHPVIEVGSSGISFLFSSPSDGAWLRGVRLEQVDEEATLRCSGGLVRTSLRALAKIKSENETWDGPGNVVFERRGVAIELPELTKKGAASISVDGNDSYSIEFLHAGSQVGEVAIEKRVNGGGLAVHRIAVPEAAQEGGFDEVRLRVIDGDGSYSLGHLVFE